MDFNLSCKGFCCFLVFCLFGSFGVCESAHWQACFWRFPYRNLKSSRNQVPFRIYTQRVCKGKEMQTDILWESAGELPLSKSEPSSFSVKIWLPSAHVGKLYKSAERITVNRAWDHSIQPFSDLFVGSCVSPSVGRCSLSVGL